MIPDPARVVHHVEMQGDLVSALRTLAALTEDFRTSSTPPTKDEAGSLYILLLHCAMGCVEGAKLLRVDYPWLRRVDVTGLAKATHDGLEAAGA